jgi:hypothetical protein
VCVSSPSPNPAGLGWCIRRPSYEAQSAFPRARTSPPCGRMARLKGQVEPLAVDRVALVNAEVAEKLEKMRAEERAKPAAAAREKLTAAD